MSDAQVDDNKKCPSCKEAEFTYRQETRPHLCAWCGYNHDTGEVAGFVPASDPFAHLDEIPYDDDK